MQLHLRSDFPGKDDAQLWLKYNGEIEEQTGAKSTKLK